MPCIPTHLHLGRKIVKKNNKLDKDYFLSGTIYPDFYYFLKTKNNLSNFLHEKDNYNQIGIDFGYKLIEDSKDIKEISFSLGFLFHFLLDKKVHNYLRQKSYLKNYNHTVIENYLSLEHKRKIPFLKAPKRLLIKVFKNYQKEVNLNFLKKSIFWLKVKTLSWAIHRKYKKKKNDFLVNRVLNYGYSYEDIKERKKIIDPLNVYKEDFKKIKKEMFKIEKEIDKIVKQTLKKHYKV